MKTIGITGASGMIGSKVLTHLQGTFPEAHFKCLVRSLPQALKNRGGKACHVIFSSSGGAIYGYNPLDGPDFDEDQPCQPVSPYGKQKLAVENYIRLGVLQGWLSATSWFFNSCPKWFCPYGELRGNWDGNRGSGSWRELKGCGGRQGKKKLKR